jgi:hypothetical protein
MILGFLAGLAIFAGSIVIGILLYLIITNALKEKS